MEDTIEFIARICTTSPDQIALRADATCLSYGELDDQANQLADLLRGRGVQQGGTVAICLERSFKWVIAALAILRAGAAYVPLDPTWPEARLRYALQDSGATLLLSNAERHKQIPAPCIGLDPWESGALTPAPSVCKAPATMPADGVAYVIYTSGSTGRPKGVEITRANLSHLVEWHCAAFSITAADHASHMAGLGFDAAGWELWPYLAAGATISLVEEPLRASPELLHRWLIEEKITMAFVPTAMTMTLLELSWPSATRLRFLLTGGDTLLRGPGTQLPFELVNNYGPAECTVVSTSGVVPMDLSTMPTIGRPIAGAQVYLLSEDGAPVASGETGEIYIGGRGVGRGYRNLPELSASSFLPDPFAHVANARMYRTGDQAILLPDGQLSFRGRLDNQVKVRGQRIELDEISSVLQGHPAVAFCVVVHAHAPGEDAALTAYILLADNYSPTVSELQAFLAANLPAYMIPDTFVQISSLPLSHSGKIDRSLLEAATPSTLLPHSSEEEPISAVKGALLAMVRRLLGRQDVAVDDNFFFVGGHSLLGTRLVLRIREMYGVELTLRDLFASPSVTLIARKVEDMLLAEVEALTEEQAAQQAEA